MLCAHTPFLHRAQAWAAGHAIVLLTALYALVGVVTFRPHPYAYKLSYIGATGASGVRMLLGICQPSDVLTALPTAVTPHLRRTAGCSEQCPGWVLIPSCSASDALASSSRVSQLTPARLRIDRHATGHRGREWSLPRSNANKPSLPAHTRRRAQCLTSAVQISRHPFAEQSLRPASPARRECPISPARPLLELPCVSPCPVR